jgi:hypothetical protein
VVCRNTLIARATCRILFKDGSWTASSRARTVHYTVRHGRAVVARGKSRIVGRRLVVRLSHRLRHGRYRITVTTGHGRHKQSFTQTLRVR